jgi:hypothetical protein
VVDEFVVSFVMIFPLVFFTDDIGGSTTPKWMDSDTEDV